MVLIQGGGTLLAQCKNTLWMIVEAEENASKSPSPSQTPDRESDSGGFSDSQGSGNVSPTITDMDRRDKMAAFAHSSQSEEYESELCSACMPTNAVRRGAFTPLPSSSNSVTDYDQWCDDKNNTSDAKKFVLDSMGQKIKCGDNSDLNESEADTKGPLDDLDLLQGAGVIPPPMPPLTPLNGCKSKVADLRDCKCKIVFKKCEGKQIIN